MNQLQTAFSKDYAIIEENYGNKQGSKSVFKINKVQSKNPDNAKDNLISVHFPKNIDVQTLSKLRQFKYISVIRPKTQYDNNDEYILIYVDYLNNQLNNENKEKWKEQMDRIFLQLTLFYAELEQRQYKWPLKDLEQLYFIDGLLYVSLGDYDFTSANSEEQSCQGIFAQFAKKHFKEQMIEIQKEKKKDFREIVEFLCGRLINNYDNEPKYQNVLIYLLGGVEFQMIAQTPNSVVKSFKTPKILLDFYPELKMEEGQEQESIFKTSKQTADLYKKKVDREIELMEENKSKYIVVCSFYFRILNTSFLIMRKYPETLQTIKKKWNPPLETLRRDVYIFSYKFAKGIVIFLLQALNDLHQQYIQHRDLKPNNIFLNHKQIENSDVFIADLDRAKINNPEQTEMHLQNNQRYDPPEEKVLEGQQYTYDVFQYGIILLQVANKGKYVGLKMGPRQMTWPENNTFEKFYSREAIGEKLKGFNYDVEFLDLIYSCLRKDPKDRNNSQEIFQTTDLLYQKKVLNIEETVLITVKKKSLRYEGQLIIGNKEQVQQETGQDQQINQQVNYQEKIAKFQDLLKNHFLIGNKVE